MLVQKVSLSLSFNASMATWALKAAPNSCFFHILRVKINDFFNLTADGVLVLESATQAMLLPIVSDVNNIPNPSPGMMVFVNKAGAKRLAVYNGAKWSFWKPAS